MKFFPHPTLRGHVNLRVRDPKIDGVKPIGEYVNDDLRHIDLLALDPPAWSKLEMQLVASVPEDELERIQPEGSGNAVMVAVTECAKTNARRGVRLTPSTADPTMWVGTVQLDRDQCRGRVTLRANLAGSVGGRSHRFLGSSAEWSVFIDESEAPPSTGLIRITWVDFGAEEAPVAVKPFPHEIFYADLEDAAGPRVYLNGGILGLPELLDDRDGRSRIERALHDAHRFSIGTSVWMGLFNSAAAGVGIDEETQEMEQPPLEWQRSVLDALLPKMYPDDSDSDRLRAVWEAVRGSDGARGLESLAQVAVGQQLKTAASLRRTIEGLEGAST